MLELQIRPPTTADSERRGKSIVACSGSDAQNMVNLHISKREYVSSPPCLAPRHFMTLQLLNCLDWEAKYNSGESGQMSYMATVSRQHRSQ